VEEVEEEEGLEERGDEAEPGADIAVMRPVADAKSVAWVGAETAGLVPLGLMQFAGLPQRNAEATKQLSSAQSAQTAGAVGTCSSATGVGQQWLLQPAHTAGAASASSSTPGFMQPSFAQFAQTTGAVGPCSSVSGLGQPWLPQPAHTVGAASASSSSPGVGQPWLPQPANTADCFPSPCLGQPWLPQLPQPLRAPTAWPSAALGLAPPPVLLGPGAPPVPVGADAAAVQALLPEWMPWMLHCGTYAEYARRAPGGGPRADGAIFVPGSARERLEALWAHHCRVWTLAR